MRSAHKAFTLVELILVLAVIGILAVLAVPRFANSLARQRVEMAANRIAGDLSLAREHAIATSSIQTVKFDTASNTYALASMGDLDHSEQAYGVDLSAEPYEATIVSADLGGDTGVIFDGYGVPDSGGTVVIRVGANIRTIALDGDSGQASVQ